MTEMALPQGAASTSSGPWLWSKKFDLTYLILPGLLVVVPPLLHELFVGLGMNPKISRNIFNLLIGGLVGGPHMYATFTRTFLNKEFRKEHPFYWKLAFIVPAAVIALAIYDWRLLLTCMFFWASIHVLHQTIYLANAYRTKQNKDHSQLSIWIDALLVLSCLYPVASYKLINGQFWLSGFDVPEKLPGAVLGAQWIWMAVTAAFVILLVAWLIKTGIEIKTGTVNWPKTLLIGITVPVAVTLPLWPDLDTAFQGFNFWHSVQYTAFMWMIHKMRVDRGEVVPGFARKAFDYSSERRSLTSFFLRHLSIVGIFAVVGAGVFLFYRVAQPWNWVGGEAWDLELTGRITYFSVGLSSLLTHYFMDHLLFFTKKSDVVAEARTPATAIPGAVPA